MFTVATYNVHSCVGGDRRFDPPRVAAVLREIDAEIIALQEVDASHRHEGYLDQWKYLAEAAGYHCIPGISLRTHRNIFGNALFLRGHASSTRLHDLSVGVREPRGAIDAELELEGLRLRVVATHFGLRLGERRQQAAWLLGAVTAKAGLRTILLGDLNEWRPRARSIRTLFDKFLPGPSLRSFPARYPLFALDRILVSHDLHALRYWVHASPLARKASDHLPVCACIGFTARMQAA